MIHRPKPIAVREVTAAAMFDISASKFRGLVECGALPPPKEIGGITLWRVADLDAVLSGHAAKPNEDQDFE